MDSFGKLKTDALNPETLYVTCPYNASHRILRARLQYHLVKCRKNFKEKPEEEKVICPLDATHHVNKEELAEHMKICPNRKIVDSERYLIETEASEPASSYKLPDMPPCEENWDDPSEPTYTYDPRPHLENQPILRTKHGATKSERKAFRQVERMKMIQFHSGLPMNTDEAAAAVGVTIANGKFLGRGRGLKPLGQEGLGPAKTQMDLERLVGDGVGRTLPVEVGPLRPPKQESIALRLAKCSLADGDSSHLGEEEVVSSHSAIGQSSQIDHAAGDGVARGAGRGKIVEPKAVFNDNDKKSPLAQDWWNQNNNTSNKSGGSTVNLEEYKQKVKESKLAARMGLAVGENILDDDDRARNFTYLDEEWQVQGRRGRVNRGASAQSNRSLAKGRNF
ncbi:uncharacterized protein LOC124164341 [Ischnura elegans]|uniref:uncharacterized protein LOC124164341 n=1 Tax=Ischnura elegans TaxID=197161 RepID=UPI001ED88AD1|nr:uncharacterized protein LOC124164341 [Ischnura elegans]